MDPKRIRLRRLEVQIHYDTAFLWFDTKGAIGQKWAYAGDFGQWRLEDEALVLIGERDDASYLAAFGARRSQYIAEEAALSWNRTAERVLQWMGDCATALSKVTVRQIVVRSISSVVLANDTEREAVQAKLLLQHPTLSQILPRDGGQVGSGVSYNSLTKKATWERRTSCQLGIYTVAHLPNYFLRPLESDGTHGGFGAICEVHYQPQAMPQSAVRDSIRSNLDYAYQQDQSVRSGGLVPVIAHA